MALKDYLTEKRSVVIVFLVAIFLLSLPLFIREIKFDGILQGEEPYYHARIANLILDSGIPETDSLSYQGREYILDPYHLVLAGFGYFITVETASKFLPFFFGLLSLLLFYLILIRFGLDLEHRFIASIMLVISPPFLYASLFSTQYCLLLFLNLLLFYMFINKKTYFLSVILALTLPFFSIKSAAITLAFLLVYACYSKEWKKYFGLFFPVAALTLVWYTLFYLNHGLPEKISFLSSNIIQQFFTDLGGYAGFGVFNVVLSLIGIGVTWKEMKKVSFLVISLIIFSFVFNEVIFYLCAVFAVYSSIAVMTLLRRKWAINLVKEFTILIIFCGLIFSAGSLVNRISNLGPDQGIVDALLWLNHNSHSSEAILSHYKNGFWVEFLAEQPVVMDSNFEYAPEVNMRNNLVSNIFSSRNLEETTRLLNNLEVDYIFITKDMKEGLVWSREEEGLLFLMQNSERFKNVYKKGGIEIWKYRGGLEE